MPTSAPLLLIVLLLLSGCGPTTVSSLVKEQGVRQMNAAEILTLVRGNTLHLHAFNEDTPLYFAPTGKVYGQLSAREKDKGSWDVSQEGELCFRMDGWWYGDLRCFTVYHIGDRSKVRLATPGGVLQYSAEQEQGDSRQLLAGAERNKKSLHRSVLAEEGERQAKHDLRHLEKTSVPAVEEVSAVREYGGKDISATVEYMARDCPGCNLAGADLGRSDLIAARLSGADLHGANLSMANLRRADLRKADLRGAILAYANLPGADLREADLRGANLKGANLIKADLTGARLEGADLSEVLKEGARGL